MGLCNDLVSYMKTCTCYSKAEKKQGICNIAEQLTSAFDDALFPLYQTFYDHLIIQSRKFVKMKQRYICR